MSHYIEINKKKSQWSSSADIHPDAMIHPSVEINSFAIIEEDVIIEAGTRIGYNAIIMKGSRIGKDCKIFPGAVIGAEPQDLKYEGEYSEVIIGDNTTIREYVTINKGTFAKMKTQIGSNVLIMAYSHIGHDCFISDNVVIANATHIAGEVIVDQYATISAGVLIHQFSRIGENTMIQGGSKVTKDIPPYITVGRDPLTYMGVNIIGLKRRNFSQREISDIKLCYKYIYEYSFNTSQALQLISENVLLTDKTNEILQFITHSNRGIIKK